MAPQQTAASSAEQLAVLMPVIGCRYVFRYPVARRFRHNFYTGRPGSSGSRNVTADESAVDLLSWIVVEDIHEGQYAGAFYVAVQFTNVDGTALWTNYSRNAHYWLLDAA